MYFEQFQNNAVVNKIVVPKVLVPSILNSYHNSLLSAHFGIRKTILKTSSKYHWPSLSADTTDFIKKCQKCQFNQRMNCNAGLAQPIQIETGIPMTRITLDFTGPFCPSYSKAYILVCTCATTKFVIAKAYAKADANATVDFLLYFITTFGTPQYLHTDKGLHFINATVRNFCEKFKISHVPSTAYHPES